MENNNNKTEQLLEEINERGRREDSANTFAGCMLLIFVLPFVAFFFWLFFL